MGDPAEFGPDAGPRRFRPRRPIRGTLAEAGALALAAAAALAGELPAPGTWAFRPGERVRDPFAEDPSGWRRVPVGFRFAYEGKWALFRRDVVIPQAIGGVPAAGRPVGMRIECGEGGEVFVGETLRLRFDNDHPAAVLLAARAVPGRRVPVAVQSWPPPGGGGEVAFGRAELVLMDPDRAVRPRAIRVDAGRRIGRLPPSLIGLSQGGGMCDYEDATAAALRALRVRWFRMDNVLTAAVREADGGPPPAAGPKGEGSARLVHDFGDLDRRVDFIRKAGAEPILCLSYMPIPFDAVPDEDRHSVPKDFALWEDLVYRAARHLRERGTPVRYWEVWNEPNSGWLTVPEGTDAFLAYAKLYAASARGVRRAQPDAWIGGPANASGPWDRSPERGYCVHGRRYVRGLIAFCHRTGTPLDFISWHEYWHPAPVFREEAAQIRAYLAEFPDVARGVRELLLTEWNFAWWADRAQDCEIGAAWTVATFLRGILPAGIAKPCFFYAKDGDASFRGSYGLLMAGNRPKPAYHAVAFLNRVGTERLALEGEDEDLAGIAARDPRDGAVRIVLANYRDRWGTSRPVRLIVENLPPGLRGGRWRRRLVDATHGNIFGDRARCEAPVVGEGRWDGRLDIAFRLALHAITEIEIARAREAP